MKVQTAGRGLGCRRMGLSRWTRGCCHRWAAVSTAYLPCAAELRFSLGSTALSRCLADLLKSGSQASARDGLRMPGCHSAVGLCPRHEFGAAHGWRIDMRFQVPADEMASHLARCTWSPLIRFGTSIRTCPCYVSSGGSSKEAGRKYAYS